MKKILLRLLVLIVIFVFAFIVFYNSILEHTSESTGETVEAYSARLPMVSFMINGVEINLTKGYRVLMDDTYPRHSITPISATQELSILIDSKANVVKRLDYEVLDIPSLGVIESGEIASFEKDDERLKVNLTLAEKLSTDTEYLMKITLINSEGNMVYYYTRLQVATFGSLIGSMEFAEGFHNATFDKEGIYDYEDYLETDEDETNTNLAYVNIKSDVNSVGYGELQPVEIYRAVPTITEYTSKFTSVAFDFYLSTDENNEREVYKCRENYRFEYGAKRCTLYNYDRTMDKVFTGKSVMADSKKIKLGITNEKNVVKHYSEDNTQLVFAYQGVLWHLDMANNSLCKIFTFEESDYDRNISPEYDYEVLSVAKNGDCQFAVYGYIGKGAYEGRMGIIYYNYYAKNGRIEEKMFVPVNVDYSLLAGEFGKVSYVNDYDVFYFTLFDGYYSYELDTNSLRTEVADLGENWLYFEDESLLVYNEKRDLTSNEKIQVKNIVDGKTYSIDATPGTIINLLGTVDNRLVYGIGNPKYVSFNVDGDTLIPYTSIIIAELDGTVVNEYKPQANNYVGNVDFSTGIISFKLYELAAKPEGNKKAVFNYLKDDVIVNLNSAKPVTQTYTSEFSLTKRTEYFLTLPNSYKAKAAPKVHDSKTLVITKDTSALIDYKEDSKYYIYAYGRVVDITNKLGDAIMTAYENSGAVVRSDGTVVWRRGVVETNKEIYGLTINVIGEKYNESQSVLQSLYDYRGVQKDASGCDMTEKALLDWMKEDISPKADVIRNCKMRQVLYFVSDGHPVIATYRGMYIVIYRFTSEYVYFIEPKTAGRYALEKDDFEKEVNDAGGVYYVY